MLREVPTETPLRMNGSYVIPSHLRTDHPRKTFDIGENRALLAFAEAVAAALGRILDKAPRRYRPYRKHGVSAAGDGRWRWADSGIGYAGSLP